MMLNDFIIRVINALNESTIKYVIVGGVALILTGRTRTTIDLDLIIENRKDKVNRLIHALEQQNFDIDKQQLEYAMREKHNMSIFDKSSIMRIDLKIAYGEDDVYALNNSEVVYFKGIQIKIPTIEQILYSKLIYIGNIDDLSDADLIDITDIQDFIITFKSNKHNIDLKSLKNRIHEKGHGKTLDRILKLID